MISVLSHHPSWLVVGAVMMAFVSAYGLLTVAAAGSSPH